MTAAPSVKASTAILDAALAYAQRGWPVIPLLGKLPLTNHGFKDASTDASVIRGWWKLWPHAWVGIVVGPASGLCVVDIDPRNGSEDSLAGLPALPATLEARTGGGGRHLFYRYDDRARRRTIAKGVELKAHGGYVVAAPSGLNPTTGAKYEWVNPDADLASLPPWLYEEPKPAATNGPVTVGPAYGRAALEREADAVERASEGERNHQLNRSAFALGQLVADSILDRAEVEYVLQRAACAVGLTELEARTTIRSGLEAGIRNPRGISIVEPARPLPESLDTPDHFQRTEMGLADRFAHHCAGKVRYVHDWHQWVIWDGQRWKRDEMLGVVDMMRRVVRGMYAHLEHLEGKKATELVKHIKESERDRYVHGALKLASSLPEIATKSEVFDADPWLLNTPTGILNLKTGEVARHSSSAMLTKITGANYDHGAAHPDWKRFLETSVPDESLRNFLQLSAGYTATGDTSLECLYLIHGPAASGKSTFIEAVSAALGDYACTADFETFLKKRGDAGIRNDVARLDGARMVKSVEVEEGRALAVGLVKQLTGGDKVTARFLHREHFEFDPAFKLWLVANHRPRAAGDDEGLWRRVHVLPFEHSVPAEKRDPKLKHRLSNDPEQLAAVLWWIALGAYSWSCAGCRRITPPGIVDQATGDYRSENDVVGQWISERVVFQEHQYEKSASLFADFREWCERSGLRVRMSKVAFGRRLSSSGINTDEGRNYRIGVSLKTGWE